MQTIIPNNNRCNKEFVILVKGRLKKIISRNNIVCYVKYQKNEFGRYTGAIIRYKCKNNKKESEE